MINFDKIVYLFIGIIKGEIIVYYMVIVLLLFFLFDGCFVICKCWVEGVGMMDVLGDVFFMK